MNAIRGSVADMDVSVIGPTVQIYESSEMIKTEYIKAAAYAVAAILILLCLDFRRLSDALCAMAPVTIGFIGAFGLMGVLGVSLNFANIIVLPLIFGIGVSAGVHVVHRWRLEPSGRPRGLSGGTGRGITLPMLTTMIGFGCLLIAKHRAARLLLHASGDPEAPGERRQTGARGSAVGSYFSDEGFNPPNSSTTNSPLSRTSSPSK